MTAANMNTPRTIDGGARPFAGGVLVELAAALRELSDGELVAITSPREDLHGDLEAWSRITGHAIVVSERKGGIARWVVRKGAAALGDEPERPIGSRLWLYTNFDCNLRCDYCCVRSSPTAPRRALGKERIARIASEARELGTESFFVTGGEPFILEDIGEILTSCAESAPTTVLTNGMLFAGTRIEQLRSLPRDRVTLQISIDSATSELHDLHRGRGSWEKAMRGVRIAREEGFRIRLAATVSSEKEEAEFRRFLDKEDIPSQDRLVRRIALRGFATDGVPLARRELVPEPTFTDRGVYWHPVGATDDDFLVTPDIFPLQTSIETVRREWQAEREVHDSIARIFHCA
jgi:organic radical activating enzyme